MFGENIKDQFGQPLYKELTFEELENLCNGMVAFAKSQPPLDSVKLAAEAKKDTRVKSEMTEEGMLRVRGTAALKGIDQYNKFVRLGFRAVQLCYYEMDVPDMGRVGQMTVVDNYGIPLEKELVAGMLAMFFGEPEYLECRIMPTPPHVAVGVRLLEKKA